ncbi:MAG: AAA family ATPase [Candidatus Bipolaricaulia bacterium]
MTSKLDCKSLKIHRFPGFNPADGFSLEELSPGVNVIYGPNGSGKTTIAKAIRNLMWPQGISDECHLTGYFSLDENELFLENENGEIKCLRNGVESDEIFSSLPASDHSGRYYLALHELLQENTTNKDFAEIIARESAGGYDLSAVEKELDFRTRPSNAGQTTDARAKRKLEKVNRLRDNLEELQDEEESLEKLKEELQRAKRAERRADFLEEVVDYRKDRKELEELRRQLNSFADPVKKLEGNEKDRLKALNDEIAKVERKKKASQKKVERARSLLDELGLSEAGLPCGLIPKLEEKADKLKTLEEKLEEVESSIAEQRGLKKRALDALADEVQEEDLKKIDITAVQNLAEFIRKAEEVRSGLKSYRQLSDWLQQEEVPKTSQDDLREGKRYLEEWLRANTASGQSLSPRWVGRALGILDLAAVVPLVLLVDPMFLLLLVPAGGFFWLARQWDNNSGNRTNISQRYQELGLQKPDDWTEKSVRKLIRKLVRREAKIALSKKKEDFLAAKKEQLTDLERKKDELEERKRELVDQYGVAPDINEGKLYWLIERLNKWEKANEELAGLIDKKEELVSSLSGLREELSEDLSSYGYETLENSSGFRGAIRDLSRRKDGSERARDRLNEAKKRQREAEDQLKELKKERRALFEKFNLEVGNRTKLFEYTDQLEEYRSLQAEVRERKAVCEAKLEELKEREEFSENLLNSDFPDITRELKDLKDLAEKKDRLFETKTKIEERIRGRKNKKELEMARAELDRALDELERQLDSDYESLAGNVLLKFLREERYNGSRPRILDRGGEIFARVTKGEYKLLFTDASPPSFRAVDTESNETRSLEELSSGTRIQLLMSVRMAFVEQQEQGIKLPLLMDEVLANSDDVRASEVIDVALEFSRDGRQVFYLTAQGDEVARWRDKLEETPEVRGNFIDLSEIRKLDDSIRVPDSTGLSFEPNPPTPTEGVSHEKYGKDLNVPTFDPRRGSGSAHLWYLVEDVDLLYKLVKLGIDTWGQFKALNNSSAKILKRFNKHKLERITGLGQALERYVKAWWVGRNRLIDRTVLEKSGAVTDNFIEEVTSLTRECDGEPERIVQKLEEGEVAGFRTSKKNELETYLSNNGYISNGEKLSRDEIRNRVLSSSNFQNSEDFEQSLLRLLTRLSSD